MNYSYINITVANRTLDICWLLIIPGKVCSSKQR